MEYDEFSNIYSDALPGLVRLKDRLDETLSKIVEPLAHIDRCQCRVKGAKSAYKKYVNKYANHSSPLANFEDLVAARIIVFFTSDIPVVRTALLDNFDRVERTEKKPEFDDQFGYESEHLVFVVPPHLKPDTTAEFCPSTFELQLRTILMHAYAEPQHDILYKSSGEIPKTIRRRLAWIAASCWGADREYEELRRWSEAIGN
ncbi:RelA/SpoT domain-containing protein [Mesorhizobium sp. VK23B]|uniref:RelA/SpoT domain-containing protein n=1 Tax=Mesorhizobium dulcispinae TaxID=3072316 RepID=A0ABU4XPB5_9HYPH|nr:MULTISPECIES: RelA/SpoT domain-containing protein [unclassified Mesorhizobium]MDX8470209.1 RelA/SpoT domain-containing protein [Mesorhizobium sp. VK23B]MDX8476595.1 RelA/SpoT domain-containing protein [Mesorhizobium sp. VK23A]